MYFLPFPMAVKGDRWKIACSNYLPVQLLYPTGETPSPTGLIWSSAFDPTVPWPMKEVKLKAKHSMSEQNQAIFEPESIVHCTHCGGICPVVVWKEWVGGRWRWINISFSISAVFSLVGGAFRQCSPCSAILCLDTVQWVMGRSRQGQAVEVC